MWFFDSFSFLKVTFFLFFSGLIGVFVFRKNLIILLISLELMLFGVNLNFLFFSVFLDEFFGQIVGLLVLTLAAAEASLGLAFMVNYYRNSGVIATDALSFLKG